MAPGTEMLVSTPCHIKPYVRYSLIRLSDQVHPTACKAVDHFLEQDLKAAFGTADQLIREMKVRVMFKGVTYELLSDPAFVKAATKAIPDLERFHTEIDAAEARKEPSAPGRRNGDSKLS